MLSEERAPSSVIVPEPGVLPLPGERGPSSAVTVDCEKSVQSCTNNHQWYNMCHITKLVSPFSQSTLHRENSVVKFLHFGTHFQKSVFLDITPSQCGRKPRSDKTSMRFFAHRFNRFTEKHQLVHASDCILEQPTNSPAQNNEERQVFKEHSGEQSTIFCFGM